MVKLYYSIMDRDTWNKDVFVKKVKNGRNEKKSNEKKRRAIETLIYPHSAGTWSRCVSRKKKQCLDTTRSPQLQTSKPHPRTSHKFCWILLFVAKTFRNQSVKRLKETKSIFEAWIHNHEIYRICCFSGTSRKPWSIFLLLHSTGSKNCWIQIFFICAFCYSGKDESVDPSQWNPWWWCPRFVWKICSKDIWVSGINVVVGFILFIIHRFL